jgi:hypothetical protein
VTAGDAPRLALLALVAGLVGCGDHSCTLIGCFDQAVTSGHPVDRAALGDAELTVTACWNDECATIAVDEPSPRLTSRRCRARTGASFQIHCSMRDDAEAGVTFGASLSFGEASPVRDGDVVSLRLDLAGAEAPLVSTDATAVTWSDWRPNGAGCEPACRLARF